MLGPWAVPGGTNANGDKSEIMDNEANMVATSSAQVESLQVGPVSDRAGDVRTPLLGIPLKAGEAVRRTEAGIPPGPPEKAASAREGEALPEQANMRLRSRRRIIRLPVSREIMELRESLAQAREQQRYEDQEKRLLARLESLCLGGTPQQSA